HPLEGASGRRSKLHGVLALAQFERGEWRGPARLAVDEQLRPRFVRANRQRSHGALEHDRTDGVIVDLLDGDALLDARVALARELDEVRSRLQIGDDIAEETWAAGT